MVSTRVIATIGSGIDGETADVRRIVAAVRSAGADGLKMIVDGADTAASVVADAGDLEVVLAPYDLASFCRVSNLPVSWKIDPPLLTHLPLIEEVARRGRAVYAGIAGCTKRELDDTVRRLPDDAVLVHTVMRQNGPIEVFDVAHLTGLQRYRRPVGYADGGRDTSPALTAVALGATMIEKPLILEDAGQRPDRANGLSPREFRSFVASVRHLETVCAGDGARDPQPDELDAIDQHRVSIVAAQPIPRGTMLQAAMLTLKAPGAGLSPRFLPFVEGRRTLYDIPEGALVTFGVIEL